jgi:hypothetical protein
VEEGVRGRVTLQDSPKGARRKELMRRVMLLRGIVIGGLLLLGAGLFLGVFLGKGTGSSRETPGSAAKDEPGVGNTPEDKPGIGDTQNVGDLSVTLVEAFRTDGDEEEDENYRDDVPPNGTFVVARVRVQNGSTEPIIWFEHPPYIFVAYSTDGRRLYDAMLSRQFDVGVPREDPLLYNTEIRPGGDVTGTIAFIAELDESVSLEFSKAKEQEFKFEPLAVWEFGPVGELPKRAFESQD